MPMPSTRLARAGLLIAAFAVTLTAVHAAPADEKPFNIPAQRADVALVEFAKQGAVEVLFSSTELKAVQANAVVGRFTPDAALALLLRGTGFGSARTSTGKLMIVRDRRRAAWGEIRGVVVGSLDGQPVANATVRLGNTNGGTRARGDGSFVLRELGEDAHAIVVHADGFAPLRITDILVAAGRRTEIGEVRLALAGDAPQQLGELVVNAAELATLSVPTLLALQEVVVTPSRFGIEEERGAIAATLTESDLLALPQFGEDLYRAISHLPGLAADDVTARFWVRGAPHEQVLARLDGVEVIEPFHLKDTDGSLSIIDIEAISRLDLYTGGFTSEFGDRLAGVLTMETDSYARARPRTTLGVSLTGARISTRGQTRGGRSRWLASGRSGYPDLALKAQEAGDSEIRPRYYDLMGKWEFQLTPDHTLSLHALHAADRMRFIDSDGPMLLSRYGSDYFWARWRGTFGQTAVESVLHHTRVSWHRDGSGPIEQQFEMRVQDDRELRTWGLRQDWTHSFSERALLRAGFEAKHGKADYDYNSTRERPAVRNGVFVVDRQARATQASPDGAQAGAYFAARWQPWPELTLEPGGRYDRNSYADDSDMSPRFNAALQRGRSTLRAAWGLHHQAQGLHRLAVQDGDATFRPAERAEHRVLSLEHRLKGGVQLRLEGYERVVRRPRPHWENVVDAIDAVSEVEFDRVRIDPVRMRARGVELIAERRGAAKLAWSASYAYARTEETLRSGVTIPRMRDQRHTFYLDAAYTPNPRWQFSIAWQYHTGWPITERRFSSVPLANGGRAIVSELGPLYGLRLPAYQRLDLRAQRRFQLPRGTLRAYVDVFNAFGRENVIDYRYSLNSSPTGQLVTTRTTGDTLFPFMPSVGLTWDF